MSANDNQTCPECKRRGYLILPSISGNCQTCLKLRIDFIDKSISEIKEKSNNVK